MTSEDIQFEKALARLEKIVQDLEMGNIPLDEALKKYEEGVKLSRACQQKLVEAEKKIEVLTRTLSGSFKKEPFVSEEAEAKESEKKKNKKPAKGEKAEGSSLEDEDLLF
jgi:exodeoxyribonuclease VII small subunit